MAKGDGFTGQQAFLKALDVHPSIPWWDPSRVPLFSENDKESVYMLYGIYRADTAFPWITIIIMLVVVALVYYVLSEQGGPTVIIAKKDTMVTGQSGRKIFPA
jgi:hypothetical protein